jgi:hypothetical protein
VTVTVDPSFLALTKTPSSVSCPAETLPASAVPACRNVAYAHEPCGEGQKTEAGNHRTARHDHLP